MASKSRKRTRDLGEDSATSSTTKKKAYCHFKDSWKSRDFSVNNRGATISVSGEVLSGVDRGDTAKCKVCGVNFSVRHGGANDVVKHFSSKNHLQAMSSLSQTLDKFGFGSNGAAQRARKKQEEEQLQVQRAESLFVQFVAEHNLPFRVGDHFTKLVKVMFPDSSIAKQFHCSRTKTSVLVHYGSGSFCHDRLIETLTSTSTPVYYSLLIDESNNRGVEAKDLVVLLRFFDSSVMKAVTRFIDLPTSNDGSAAAIFRKIDECLLSRGLAYEHLVSFNSDTCNTMKGKRNGVVRHLTDKQPNLIDLGCICHLENLALKAAMKSLPISVDTLLVDINTHFYLSSKRKEALKDFCDFVDVTYKRILAHVETRWLSLLRVTARVLQLWPGLVSYFHSHADAEKSGRVQTIKSMLSDRTKLYLLFLNHILPTINAFNIAFQATSYTTIHLLHPEMKRLTKRLLRCFIKMDAIDLNDITKTPYDTAANQLGNDEVEVGDEAKALALGLCEEGMEVEVSSYFDHVRLFYSMLIKKLIEKFPFTSTFLSDLRILNPSQRVTYEDLPNAVVRLAKRLPQLNLSGPLLEVLKTEAIDFQMAEEEDLPQETSVDTFWADMHQVKQIGSSTPLYSHLLTLVRALLSLPASNADSERCFSMVRKVDSEERGHLERSTVASLLSLKLNIDENCYDYNPPEELLKINKSAVRKYNTEHGSYSKSN